VLGFITPKEKVEDTTTPTTIPQTNMSYPSNETYSKLEKATSPEHTKYIRDAVNNLDLNLLVNDYADRVNERKQEKEELSKVKAELEKTKEELNKLALTSIAKTDKNLENDKVVNQEAKTPQNENKEGINQSSQKTIFQSKKFASLVVSAGLGVATIFLKPDQATILLAFIAQVEMTYLGTQTLIDTNVVNIIKSLKK